MEPRASRRPQTEPGPPPCLGKIDRREPARRAVPDSFWSANLSAALLDRSIPAPLYHQIYLVLRDVIRHPDLSPGTTLPGEPALAQLFAVSRITVKRALNELADENLVSRERGRGTIIASSASLPIVRSSFDDLMESLQQMGLATEIELLEVSWVRATEASVTRQMGMAPEAPLQRVVRRRLLEGEPLSYMITFTPQEIASSYTDVDLAQTPFLTLLERAGAAPVGAEQWITAVAAEPRIAAALGVRASAPLLKIERIMRDKRGRTVQLVQGFYRPDRFQYHVRSSAETRSPDVEFGDAE